MICKILHKSDLEPFLASGTYKAPSLETEGFIHCSRLEQVIGVADAIYHGQSDLLLLILDEDKLTSDLIYDKASNGEDYPHIYGPLNVEAMVKFYDFPPRPDGGFDLPEMS